MESPYDVLGIDPDADERAVVDAYRERIKDAHPDHGGSKAEFERVRRAYQRITDDEVDGTREGGTADRSPGTNGSTPGAGARTPGPGRRSPDAEPETTAEADQNIRSRVEYLNYDVLADHGWDLGDADLFEKAGEADLDPADYGRLLVEDDETLLEAAERCGFDWPFACRGGACTNCAVAVAEGEIPVPPGYILPEELIDRGIRLSCITAPTTGEAKVVYNVKHLPGVDELRLQPNRFERTRSDD